MSDVVVVVIGGVEGAVVIILWEGVSGGDRRGRGCFAFAIKKRASIERVNQSGGDLNIPLRCRCGARFGRLRSHLRSSCMG